MLGVYMKTHEEKLNLMYDEFPKKGISKSSYAPPFYRLLWKFGFKAVPPIFYSFKKIWITQGSFFTVGWGILMYFFSWRNENMSLFAMIISACFAGLLFGLIMATFIRRQSKKYNLPSWIEYGNS
jgi:hypothetical protein